MKRYGMWAVFGLAIGSFLNVVIHRKPLVLERQWLRDAAQSNKLPSFSKLNDPNYFPYRFGQAFWEIKYEPIIS